MEEPSFFKKYWIHIVLVIIVVNSLILDTLAFLPAKKPLLQNILPPQSTKTVSAPDNFCPQSCVDKINKVASSPPIQAVITIKPTALTPTPISTATPKLSPTPTIIANTTKEFFVPLGTGSGNASDWTVVSGLGAKIDPSNYGSIKTVTFEATLRIPTGNEIIWVRLYDASTYQAVSGSEITLAGGTPTLLISQPVSLTSGDHLYQIQVKTQLQYPAYIDMARIRIRTN